MKQEIKHIRGMAKVLLVLADEIEKKGKYTTDDLDLLKKVGSALLFQGSSAGYKDFKISNKKL